jgi:hypothetical protein
MKRKDWGEQKGDCWEKVIRGVNLAMKQGCARRSVTGGGRLAPRTAVKVFERQT